jgi:hypothetical protein
MNMAVITLMMEAVQTSETLVNSYQSTWRYNPEDIHLQSIYSPHQSVPVTFNIFSSL